MKEGRKEGRTERIKSNQIKQLVTLFIISNVKCFTQQTTVRQLIAEL